MSAITFYSVAIYCEFTAKMVIKHKDRKIITVIWDSANDNYSSKTYSFFSKAKAYRQYKMMIAEAILGGWKVLETSPERVDWTEK